MFKLKDLNPLKYFLGLEVALSNKGIFLNQRQYTLQLLGFLASKLALLPMDSNAKLSSFDGKLLRDLSC